MKILAVYPGRFQPFHKGHAQVYQWLRSKFGDALIATSDKVEAPKSPFNFKEKKKMMTLAGVPSNSIRQVTNPYIAREILQDYDPKKTVLVFAVSQKDMEEDPRFSFKPLKSGKPSYLQPYKGNEKNLKPFGDPQAPRGYIIVTPTFTFDVLGEPATSASELRKQFVTLDNKKQKDFIKDLFGKYDESIHKLMNTKLKAMMGEKKTVKQLKEQLNIGLTFARKEMPQVGASRTFVEYMKSNGIDSIRQKIDPSELKSSQMEFDRNKVEGLKEKPSSNPIVVSNDGYVLDGHHRWLADSEMNRKCDSYVVNLPILDLLHKAKHYTAMELNEEITRKELAPMLNAFVSFASNKLGLKSMPSVRYKTDDDKYNSFAAYNPASNELSISTINRHPMDIFRSVAHELVHHKQNEDGRLGKDIEKEGATGSDIENEANSEAGKIMRWFAKSNPHMFGKSFVIENNTAAIGGGIRGLGNVTGEVSPTVTSQYVLTNMAHTNNTQGLWVDDGQKSLWLDKKGSDEYHKKTAKGFKAVRAQLKEMSGAGALAPQKEPKTFASSLPKIKGGAVTKLVNPKDFQSNMPVLKDAPKIKQPEVGATVTDTIVGGKKQKSISINPNIGVQLEEGINDPGKLKAIFLAGGPGSGKDFVMNSALAGEGLREVNSDNAFEYLMKKQGLDMEMPDEEKVERNIVRGRAKNITKEQERLALSGRLGVIINGTADDLEKIKIIKKNLEASGYETMMVFVNTSNEVSRQRNVERGKGGGRKVPDGTDKQGVPNGSEDIRTEKWELAQKNIGELQKVFGNDNFVVIDNSVDIRKATPEVKEKVLTDFSRVRRMAQQFVRSENKNPEAKKWIEAEAQKRGITYQEPRRYKTLTQPRQSVPNVVHKPNNELMAQARRLGLSYYGFGRFGRKVNGINKVMYHSKGGRLERVQMNEERGSLSLKNWFDKSRSKDGKKGWVQVGGRYDGKPCARQPGQTTTPKCRSSAERASMTKKEKEYAFRAKQRKDPNQPEKSGAAKPTMVKTYKNQRESVEMATIQEKKDACYHKVKSRYKVWPSAYASGALVKCRKKGAANWGNKTEEMQSEACWDGYKMEGMKKKGNRRVPNCVPVNESLYLEEKKTLKMHMSKQGPVKHRYMSKKGKPRRELANVDERFEKMVEDELPLKMGYGLPIVDQGLGPETTQYRQMAALGFGAGLPLSESILSWIGNEKTHQKFYEKYGDLWEERLIDTAIMLEEAGCGCDHSGKKSVKKLKESWPSAPYKSTYGDMSAIGVQRKDDIEETTKGDVIDTSKIKSLSAYKKNIHPQSEAEKESLKEGTPAWQRKEGKNPEGGLNRKGIASYRRANPGSKLSMAVTTKPSKLKKGSKAAKRRKSFCARMGGMKKRLTSAKTARDPNSRINKALRKWNCEE